METKNISLTPRAIHAIATLQHKEGTYRFYAETLARLQRFILDQSEEIGMSDRETIHTLRVLEYLREDLAHISGQSKTPEPPAVATPEETAERVEMTFAGMTLDETIDSLPTAPRAVPGDELDEPREMLADVWRAHRRATDLQTVISEAITHATNAGDKYDCVVSDLADINGDMEMVVASLDTIMAIDPDTFEPKEATYAEKSARMILRSRDAITAAKELLDDALDLAKHEEPVNEAATRRIEWTRGLVETAAGAIAELAEKANNTLSD